jgi:zinc transport system substrate-binding protein
MKRAINPARWQQFLIASAWLSTLLVSCAAPPAPPASNTAAQTQPATPTQPEKRLKVIATFLPVYLFTKAVAGNAAQVDILIQPGTEVHEYQSNPNDVKALAETDVVVMNGLGIEEFLESTVKSAQNSKLRTIDASQGIKAIAGEESHSDHAHKHEGGNPHVWLDPVLVKQQVSNIRDGLIAADPANKATYEANAAAYIKQLEGLNTEYEQRLKTFNDRTFITFHNAFPYLAQRYQLKQVAIVEIPEDQLSPNDVKTTIDTVRQVKAKALLSEPGVDNKLLEGLSKDLNLTVRSLDSLESGERDPQYYFTAMRNNLQTLETAFK